MDKKITKRYRKEVWYQALSDARDLLGAKGELVKQIAQILLFTIALGLIAMAGYFGWQGYSNAVNTVLGLLVGNIVILLVVWLSIPIIAHYYMWNAAAKRDDAQRKRIEDYENIDTIKKAKDIKISGVNYGSYSHIKVYNGDKQNIFTGQLLLIKLNGKPLPTILELCKFVKFTRESKLEWPPEYPRELELVHIDKDSKNAFLSGEPEWMPIESGEYTLETKLVGNLSNINIEPKKTKWELILDKENLKVELKKKGGK